MATAQVTNSKHKLDAFKRAMDQHLEAIDQLIETHTAEAGSVQELSQKLTLKQGLEQLERAVNGTDQFDMKAHEAELTVQLAWFCQENSLPHLAAEDLLMEDEITLTYEQADWLEYFIERWNNRPQ